MVHNKFSDMVSYPFLLELKSRWNFTIFICVEKTKAEKSAHLGANSSLSGGNREAAPLLQQTLYAPIEDRQVPSSVSSIRSTKEQIRITQFFSLCQLDYRGNTCLSAIKDQGGVSIHLSLILVKRSHKRKYSWMVSHFSAVAAGHLLLLLLSSSASARRADGKSYSGKQKLFNSLWALID